MKFLCRKIIIRGAIKKSALKWVDGLLRCEKFSYNCILIGWSNNIRVSSKSCDIFGLFLLEFFHIFFKLIAITLNVFFLGFLIFFFSLKKQLTFFFSFSFLLYKLIQCIVDNFNLLILILKLFINELYFQMQLINFVFLLLNLNSHLVDLIFFIIFI